MGLKTAIRHIVAHTYKPLLVRYLSRTRRYRYQGISLEIPPDVFHPGFFFSTRLLLQYLNKIPLKEKRFLELGCGSGLIAINAAKKGALVTASDINPAAVDWLKKNSLRNKADIEILLSDLFENIPGQTFDVIAINPPYYKKKPVELKDHAWFCGEHGEYFTALFKTIGGYIHADTEVLMVLFEDCDMDMIGGSAAQNGFSLVPVYTRNNLLEQNSIYRIVTDL